MRPFRNLAHPLNTAPDVTTETERRDPSPNIRALREPHISVELTSQENPQPLSTRYRQAWLTYRDAQPEPPAEPVPYMSALANSTDPKLLAAAEELRRARDAWHADPTG